MDFVTIATTGNAIDFGDLTEARRGQLDMVHCYNTQR